MPRSWKPRSVVMEGEVQGSGDPVVRQSGALDVRTPMVKKRNSRVQDLRHVTAAVSYLRGIGSPDENVGSMCSVVGVVDAPATDSRTYIKHMCRATDRPGCRVGEGAPSVLQLCWGAGSLLPSD